VKLNHIYQGDALEILKTFPDDAVDMVITSPPYWALRNYGVDGQLGLEPTFQEYINKLCDIFDEVKRVLKKEGTCWVNMGDTFSGSNCGSNDYREKDGLGLKPQERYNNQRAGKTNLPDKCLLQIPSRFAIEMCNRGWILRNEIIWHKPNCMPSSVKDRFTVDFEKIFFFTKSKKYYFETQYEPMISESERGGGKKIASMGNEWGGQGLVDWKKPDNGLRTKRTVWKIATKPFKEAHFATYPEKLIETPIKAGCPEGGVVLDIFMGAGTTAKVANKLGRNYLGIELNPEYIKIAEKRLRQEVLF